MTFEDYVRWNDQNLVIQLKAKYTPELQEVIPKDLLKPFLNAKSGYIKIKKVSNNNGYLAQNGTFEGVTTTFGVGLSLSISDTSEWYRTSEIKDIFEDTFKTENSVYEYEFKEVDPRVVVKELDDYAKDSGVLFVNTI